MSELGKVTEEHRRRRAVVYVRQSSVGQVERNVESAARQYGLRERAVELGWPAGAVAVVDEDTGRSGASSDGGWGSRSWSPRSALAMLG
jgi:DNA invertase Pin-like site-specific DNA recombinase